MTFFIPDFSLYFDYSLYYLNAFNDILSKRTMLPIKGIGGARRSEKRTFVKRSLEMQLAFLYVLHSFIACRPMLTSTHSQRDIEQRDRHPSQCAETTKR